MFCRDCGNRFPARACMVDEQCAEMLTLALNNISAMLGGLTEVRDSASHTHTQHANARCIHCLSSDKVIASVYNCSISPTMAF